MTDPERVHVFNGLPDADVEYECTFALCTESAAATAELVYHPNAMQCSGESNWICTDCGEYTGDAAEA